MLVTSTELVVERTQLRGTARMVQEVAVKPTWLQQVELATSTALLTTSLLQFSDISKMVLS